MKPHLITSPSPARTSSIGSPSSSDRSQSTPAGSWNAPTRFLPAPVLMPVLPPTAASTMARTVVGTCTTLTPPNQLAATTTPRPLVAPLPSVTTAPDGVNPAYATAPHHQLGTEAALGLS